MQLCLPCSTSYNDQLQWITTICKLNHFFFYDISHVNSEIQKSLLPSACQPTEFHHWRISSNDPLLVKHSLITFFLCEGKVLIFPDIQSTWKNIYFIGKQALVLFLLSKIITSFLKYGAYVGSNFLYLEWNIPYILWVFHSFNSGIILV